MTYEKVADELEHAAHLQDQLNIAGVKHVRKALAPETPKGVDGRHIKQFICIECEDPLPPIRMAMGRLRCTTCQVEKERLAKLGRA